MKSLLTTTLTNGNLGGPPSVPITCAGCGGDPPDRRIQLYKTKCVTIGIKLKAERTKAKGKPAKLALCKKLFDEELSVAAYALDWARHTPRHAAEMLVLAASNLEIAEAKLNDIVNWKDPAPASVPEAERTAPISSPPVLSENHIG
jgi:hypothetical protein